MHSLPALGKLLPKLNGGAEVADTPKFPMLKFTAGLGVKPKPPKLNPLAEEFAVSSPPNPDEREAERKQGRISQGESHSLSSTTIYISLSSKTTVFLISRSEKM